MRKELKFDLQFWKKVEHKMRENGFSTFKSLIVHLLTNWLGK